MLTLVVVEVVDDEEVFENEDDVVVEIVDDEEVFEDEDDVVVEIVDDEKVFENEDDEEMEEIVSTELTEITLLSDPEEADAPDGLESTVIAVDYTDALILVYDELVHLNQSLDIIVMVLLAWLGSWVLRSWRTWSVKGGK